MKIKAVKAEIILDSRKEKTISVFVKNDKGTFTASAPSGKSKGKYENQSYINSINNDIKILNSMTEKLNLNINDFEELEKVEEIVKGKIGANSLFALEAAILKALASEERKQLWQLLNEKARKFPFPVGNCVGGGMHTQPVKDRKPDFQEFLIIPRSRNFSDSVFIMRKAYEEAGDRLELLKAKGKLNDENAFSTSLSNENVLEIMQETKEELSRQVESKIDIGIDAAASTFYTGLLYNYKNPIRRLKQEEQINYIASLIEKYGLIYVEDPMQENDFNEFKKLRENIINKYPCLIVGDDLTVTNLERLRKAVKEKSINAIIIKPNQTGSLIDVKKVIDFAKKNNVACVMSHRSGETEDTTIADLAFAFQCEFIKTGIKGKEREAKLNRLIQIEKSLS